MYEGCQSVERRFSVIIDHEALPTHPFLWKNPANAETLEKDG